MANPTKGDIHVNKPLTNISIAYIQDAANFIADRVFPNIPVNHQSDRYYTYDRGDFNRDEMTQRAPGTESAGGGYRVDNTPNYYAPVYAFHKDVADEQRANADSVIAMDRDATIYVSQKALIKREKLWVAKYFAAGIWATDVDLSASPIPAGTAGPWSDASSTPIEDIRAGMTTVLEGTGFEPNTLVLGKRVWDKLVDHPDIVDRVKYGQTAPGPAIVTAQAISALLELDRILVMKSIENTANEEATEVSAFIGGKKAFLCYSNPTPSLMQPSAGYTFSWNGMFGSGAQGGRIKRFRIEKESSDRIEIEMAFDQKVVGADLGYFFDNAVA